MPKLTTKRISLYYEVSGEEDAPAMVWHGHGHKTWMWQQNYFNEWYKVITYDRRGTGFSDNPPAPWSMMDFVDDLVGLLDHLDVEKIIVGGSSRGAGMSLSFALEHMERVAAVILNAGAGCGIVAIPELDAWHAARREDKITTSVQPKSGWWQKDYPPTTNPAIKETRHGGYYLKILEEQGKRTDWTKIYTLKPYPTREKIELLKTLGDTVPVLMMMGGHETQGEVLAGYELHKHVPNSHFIINPECWHAAPRERPELFNNRVHEFLKRNNL